MLKLYVRTGCPYSAAVLAKINDLGVNVLTLNVADPGVADELIRVGGEKREPFFYDDEKDIKMYESDEIVDYLEEQYGKNKNPDAH